ncbi:hypothetical protein RHMOL_Rhmol09G0057300 [Rhododendron molle]|uniref:Uncharacterized protein n=1 Tax=Rhododendron molle TaxID=49168 RepID=A0ACC0MA81_RHOML|nr:hypothetical protein RHMOL_Rhmol09G0057300 [Rhododendron molle]
MTFLPSGPLPTVALFQNMAMSRFIGNKGLCGGPFGDCNGNSSFNSIPPLKGLGATQGEIIPIVAVAVGGVSLILITVILYYMRRPVEVLASSQEEISSPVSDIYFPPKEGFSFQDLVEATSNFHATYVVGRGAMGTEYKAVMHSGQTIAVKKLESNREGNNMRKEYAYTMKVPEKCDIYSYGVVLLELLTGRTPVQPLDQGGDLVTWVRNYIREHSLKSEMLDSRVNLKDENTVNHMITVLKIALLCTNMSPFDRPSMREVVLMLIESDERYGNFISPPVYDCPKDDAS